MKIFNTKRGQGLSMNVIIIAAISLLVLVVLAVIFIGRSGTFAQTTKSCATQGGTCGTKAEAGSNPQIQNASGCAPTKVCYINLG